MTLPVAAGRRRALVALALTQTTGWGVLYYALPVALPAITRDTGWSATAVTAAFSAGLVTSALAGIPVGRWLDRHGPRLVMTTGSVLGSLAAAGVALAPTYPVFLAAWLAAGAAMAAVFYQAAFAALTRWYGPDRVRALTALTLVAGLASTVFAPLTRLLVAHLGWRGAYLVLAAILAAVCVPLHGLALTPPWRPPGEPTGVHHRRIPTEVRSGAFLALATALTVGAFCAYGASFLLIPALAEKGIPDGLAVAAFGLLGAGQLLGRIGYASLSARTTPTGRTTAVLAAGAVTLGLLAALPGPPSALVVIAVVLGALRGAATLVQATAVSDRWGGERYGTLSGWLAAPVTGATALAPWAATAAAGPLGGHVPVLGVLAVLLLLAAVVTGARARCPARGQSGPMLGSGGPCGITLSDFSADTAPRLPAAAAPSWAPTDPPLAPSVAARAACSCTPSRLLSSAGRSSRSLTVPPSDQPKRPEM